MFEQDLENSTEVVLTARKMRSAERRTNAAPRGMATRGRTTRRAAAAGAIRMGRTLGAAITKRREVGAAEAYNLFWSSLIFLTWACSLSSGPRRSPMPLGVLAVWFAVSGLFQSWRLYRREETTDRVEDKQDVAGVREAQARVI